MSIVRISEEEYKKLVADREFLQCLFEAGVDNWDGYTEAVEMFEEE